MSPEASPRSFPAPLGVPAERAGAPDSTSQPGGGFLCLVPEVSRRSRHCGESAGSAERDSAERGSVHGAGKANTGTVPGTNLSCIWLGKQWNAGREKWDPCGQVAPDKPSLLTEMLLRFVGNHLPEAGAGETPCAGTRFANEGKFHQDPSHLWVSLGTQQPQLMKLVYFPSLNVPKGQHKPPGRLLVPATAQGQGPMGENPPQCCAAHPGSQGKSHCLSRHARSTPKSTNLGGVLCMRRKSIQRENPMVYLQNSR